MAVFQNLSVLLELKYLSFKEKKKVKSAVMENGGSICFVINKQCSLVVTSDVSSLSPSRLRSIQKHQTPVVGVDYVHGCVERGALLPVDQYKLDTSSAASPPLSALPPAPLTQKAERSKGQAEPGGWNQRGDATERGGNVLEKFRIFTETDSDLPAYPDNFQVAKYAIYQKMNSWCVLELQSVGTEQGRRYRVVRYRKDVAPAEEAVLRDQLVFPSSEEALDVFEALGNSLEASGLKKRTDMPQQVQDLGSSPLQQLLLEEKLNTGSLSQEVGLFVELLWTEALGCLGNVLRVSIDKLSLNDVSRAEGFLLQAQKVLRAGDQSEVSSLLEEVYTLLPHQDLQPPPPSTKLLSQKLDLCQLIRDVLNVSEMTLNSQAPSSVGKYRALRCSIETVPPGSSEFQMVTHLLHDSVQIQQIVRVSRGLELQTFRSDLGNIKPLLHSSSPNNFVGILSRGLLLPRVGVEHHGVERTDVGNLGSGIYFSNAVSTTLKYSKPSLTDGSRLLLVCDVALGRCRDVHKRDPTLTQAPEGHHSVHGVRGSQTTTEFEDDEYVVYSPDQVRLRYVVRFCVDGDQLKEFSPTVDVLSEPSPPSSHQELRSEDEEAEHMKNPLQEVTAGLLDSSGQQLPLQAVHVKCKLMDLLSQVIIFQKYTNQSFAPIEAKYVFPLDDSAAVCGFEAFINGKHVVGQVKEKEKARKEYKQAIEQGHGAYLMDQDAPDVFTISVGNLPPGATVLIKVTFVSELVVEDGSILFSLPGSVAPWQQSAALNQTTQVSMEKVCVTDATETREFTLDVSVEMPHEIRSLLCTTHKVRMKRTDCKAVISVLPGQVMGSDGFQLSITLSEVHLPRMWVEKHPDKDSQACMLVFYPDFQLSSSSAADEVVLLLDTSESMRGEALRSAQRIALQVLRKLDHNLRLNIILFGTDHTEAFLTAQPLTQVHQAAESFIKRFSPVGGSTELWRPLRSLSLLPPPSGGVRNLLLLSDGHIQNAAFTLQLLRDNAQHSRLFTCGLSPTANRHMLRALAQAGGGAYEFFDSKAKHSWAEKVASQVKRMLSPGCSSVSVKWQQFNPAAPPPLQAPKQLHALFSDCHTLVYGFVPHCTQATLLGNLCGVELETMVSTSELQKTRGTFLHKLAARALIRDYEDGSLETSEAEHEGKKAELKSFIIELSKEFSILSQFTSFVAIEERDLNQAEDGVTNVSKLIAEEDVDFLPYVSWSSENLDQLEMLNFESEEFYMGHVSYLRSQSDDVEQENDESSSEISAEDMDFGLSLTERLRRHYHSPPPPLHKTMNLEFRLGHISRCRRENDESSSETERLRRHYHSPPPPLHKTMSPCELGSVEMMNLTEDEPGPQPAKAHIFDIFAECHSSVVHPPPPVVHPPPAVHPPPPLPAVHAPPPPLWGDLHIPYGSTSVSFSTLQGHGLSPEVQQGVRSPVIVSGPGFTGQPGPAVIGQHITEGFVFGQSAAGVSFGQSAAGVGFGQSAAGVGFGQSPAGVSFGQSAAGVGFGQSPAGVSFGQSAAGVGFGQSPAGVSFGQSAAGVGFGQSPAGVTADSYQPRRGTTDLSIPEAQILQSFGNQHLGFGSFAEPLHRSQLSTQGLSSAFMSPWLGDSSVGPPAAVGGLRKGKLLPKAMSSAARRLSSYQAAYVQGDVLPDRTVEPPKDVTEALSRKLSFRTKNGSLVSSSAALPRQPHFVQCCLMSESLSLPPPAETVTQDRPPTHDAPHQVLHEKILSLPAAELSNVDMVHSYASFSVGFPAPPAATPPSSERKLTDAELKLKWTKIFQLQHLDGFWDLTTELGDLINLNVDVFTNIFLKSKGISSLGVKAHADILRMVATLLVLQLLRMEKVEEGKLLRSLFRLEETSPPRTGHLQLVKKAVDWVCLADRQYPCVCSRLEFGLNWESSTRQLLGFEDLPPFSPLRGLELQRPTPPLTVH
ncbi:protein mono-ADP-ribosyltransferase PARP4-like isoform X2 [Melanotaenia boesemani]|uniref:protein mono-ADP-ribosyltransferase PARP4-like isoform X2 n=1 Tax=Melanotaenia boesemani TaxID=1250792 RepID=UPI001C045170|nr:protein mono-ADP-ribosyltransferase PARP4-like isoform X2 [Melanotaenia boesemani]